MSGPEELVRAGVLRDPSLNNSRGAQAVCLPSHPWICLITASTRLIRIGGRLHYQGESYSAWFTNCFPLVQDFPEPRIKEDRVGSKVHLDHLKLVNIYCPGFARLVPEPPVDV
jgi:hypothetical protein